MRFFIASDIHGSAYYCRKLLDAYKIESADRLLLLGDLLYHGPRNPLPEGYDPMAVADMLNSVSDSIICVRGNCDSDVDQMVLEFPIMADYAMLSVGKSLVLATHGHLLEGAVKPKLKASDVILHGHTHLAGCGVNNGILYCNPGSVSLPKEDTPRGYILLDGNTLEWKTLDGERYDFRVIEQ
ncbi:MAG: phosphodiesterase [Clostridia bacterium]|nr:phosphodiesterase [Clostridia bacterium]